MADAELFIEQLRNNPDYKVVISSKKGSHRLEIEGILADENLTMGSGSSNYTDIYNSLTEPLDTIGGGLDSFLFGSGEGSVFGKLTSLAKGGMRIADAVGNLTNVGGYRGYGDKNRITTTKRWSLSTFGAIRLSLYFFAVEDPKEEVMENTRKLRQLIYSPENGAFDYLMYTAPLGYNPKELGEPEGSDGTLSLKIGQWFEALNWFVCENVDIAYTPNVASTGGIPYPVAATCQVTLIPVRTPTVEDIDKWFKE